MKFDMDHSIAGAFTWFTDDEYVPPIHSEDWMKLHKKLKARGHTCWQLLTFCIWYDEKTSSERLSVLKKARYIQSEATYKRFEDWLDYWSKEAQTKVKYQMTELQAAKDRGMSPDRLLLAKHTIANTMVRLQKLSEWYDELEDPDRVYNSFRQKGYEMIMGLPLYKAITPGAWQLLKERR